MANIAEILKDLQKERAKLDQAIAALAPLAGRKAGTVQPRHKLSAAARKRIADAQRARWAKVRKEKKAA